MNSSNPYGYRGALPAVLAALIVGTSGLALDRGHLAGAPAGHVEVGPLTPVDVLPRVAALPAVIVVAPRLAMAAGQGRA